ncbi:putative leucine-rich repeat domain superfamily [Helianthus annuus]|nr:putative leucine-rich repeat domain superfamily [Helianthus annuus]
MLLHFLPLFLLLTCTAPHHISTTNHHHQSPPPLTMDPTELQTLYTIMETLSSDHQWRITYPNPCTPSTSWVGIECKPSVRTTNPHILHVTRLDFGTPPNPNCKNTATFPPEIFQLPYLQSVFFFRCFTKTKTTISTSKTSKTGFRSSSLQQLSFRSNPTLVGSIPSQLFSHVSSLQILTLTQSKISGSIPPEISELTSLVHLDLSYNKLTGAIPVQLWSLKNLVGLDLSYNSLTGQVPDTIGQLGMLQKLDLSSNMLTGSVPTGIGELSSLMFLALSNNGFHGKLPVELGNLKGLEYLIMENNPMSIELPMLFGRFPKLQELRLANSDYSGKIPDSFSNLWNLTTLSLQNNRLTGNIPVGIANLSHIYHLNLSKNLLSGEVPFGSSFLKRLGKNLDLSENNELCLDPMQGYACARLGVVVCNRSNARVDRVKPLKKSEGRVVRISRPALFIVFFVLGVLEFKR